MSTQEILKQVEQSIVNFDIEACKNACQAGLDHGIPPMEIVSSGMAKGMDIVGKKFESKEFFLPELIVAGEVMSEGMKVLKPHIKPGEAKSAEKVVLGTVRGDLHDIGKNVVSMLLEAAGFEVIDLGTDVPPEGFVEGIRKNNAHILAMSALLTITMPEMDAAIREIEKAGLRDSVKIIIGGAPVTPEYAQKIGADYAANGAVDGVNKCKAWATVR